MIGKSENKVLVPTLIAVSLNSKGKLKIKTFFIVCKKINFETHILYQMFLNGIKLSDPNLNIKIYQEIRTLQ